MGKRLTSALGIALMLVFGGLASAYSVIVPPWESPDEVAHFSFLAHLINSRDLPVQRIGDLGEAHQPPLYYIIAAVTAVPADLNDASSGFKFNPRFIWAGQGGNEVSAGVHTSAETFPFQGQSLALHLARLASVLMGMVTVALIVASGWEIFPDRRLIGLLAGALVAFNPQFLFLSSSVNNDNLVVTAASGALWQMLRAIKTPEVWSRWFAVGAWSAIAVLAKLNGFTVGIVAGLAILAISVRQRSPRVTLLGGLAMVIAVAVIDGWWFWRNQALYGDPLGWATFKRVFSAVQRQEPLRWEDLGAFVSTQFDSFWGVFGWMNVMAPSWFYSGARILVVLALFGLVVAAARGRFSKLSNFQKAGLGLLGLAIALQEVYMVWVITGCDASCYQGRYLFVVIGPLMIVMSLGLVSLIPSRAAPFMAWLLTLVLVGVAVFVPLEVIQPAYTMVPLPKSSLDTVQHKTQLTIGDSFELKGFSVREDEENGSSVRVTLYWQAIQRPDFDYSAFVHIIDSSDRVVAQKDQSPGKDIKYPPTAWWPGDIIADEHVLEMPPQLPPGPYRFRVGAYNWATGRQLSVVSEGKPLGTFAILDRSLSR